jgi:N-acetylglucosamine repressor
MIVGRHDLIRNINKKKILNTIRLHSPIARTHIAQLVDLDKKSITNFINELLEEEIIEPIGKRNTPKGRPLETLGINKKNNLAIGIDIRPSSLLGVVTDLYGNVLSSHQVDYGLSPSLEQIFSSVNIVYKGLKSRIDGTITGVGISLHGIINLETCVVDDSVNLPSMNGFHFGEEFSTMITEPLYFEECSRAKALGEKWFGLGKDKKDFICIDLGFGIGAGFIFDRRLYKGAGKYAGEIGHVKVVNNGKTCRCGSKGCLEAYVSERLILDQIEEKTGKTYKNLSDVYNPSAPVRKIIKTASGYLGLGLSTVIDILNPTMIILNGNLMNFKDIVIPEIERVIRETVLKELFQGVSIETSTLKESTALGAASLVYSRILEIENVFYV